MPNYTLAELMSNATTRAGRRGDLDQSEVSFYVNMAYEEVRDATEHALSEKIAVSSTTSGENRIELPSDFGSPINVSVLTSQIGSGRTMRRVSASRVDSTGFFPLGTPQRYVLFNNWMELHPSPDSGYSIQLRYNSMLTDLVALGDVPSVSTPWRKAILYLAEAEIHAAVDNTPGEIKARQRYAAYAAQLKNTEYRRQRDESGMGRGGHSYRDLRPRSRRSFDVV